MQPQRLFRMRPWLPPLQLDCTQQLILVNDE
jgi:hypothetical protein